MKQLEQQDELALRDEVRLAGFVDQLGNVAHRLMHGQIAELNEHVHAEQRAKSADDQARLQQLATGVTQERHRPDVRQDHRRFAGRSDCAGDEDQSSSPRTSRQITLDAIDSPPDRETMGIMGSTINYINP